MTGDTTRVSDGAPATGDKESVLQGLTPAELAEFLSAMERRTYIAGATVLVEGEAPHELYVVQHGYADAYVDDGAGGEKHVNRIGPGGAIGEMSLLTGQRVSATVRATTDLEVLALRRDEFERLAEAFPRIYRNLSAQLSRKLFSADRRDHAARTATLLRLPEDLDPRLAYALAASLAWHERRSMLLAVGGTALPDALASLSMGGDSGPRATLVLVRSKEELRAEIARSRLRQARILALCDAGWLEGLEAREVFVDSVPALGAGDWEIMRSGVLPLGSAAADALGRVARRVAGLRVGLALGAGGAKGFAHVGVLRVLARAGVPLDAVAGTSVGACVGALHLMGHPLEDIVQILDEFGATLARPTLSIRGLFSNAGIKERFRSLGPKLRLEDLPIPFATVAADMVTQREVVFTRGLLWLAVLASVSIPGFYPPLRIGRHTVVDGGVLNPVPLEVTRHLGSDVVVGVRLRNQAPERVEAEATCEAGRPPSVLETMSRVFDMMETRLSLSTSAAADAVLITPAFPAGLSLGLRSFHQGRVLIEHGEQAAEESLPRLAAALPWLRA